MKKSYDNGQTCAAKKLPVSKTKQHWPKSKKQQLINLLSKTNGARISSLCKTLDWQKHTVRAAISGLRASGFAVEASASAKDGMTVYKITGKSALQVAS